MTFRELVDAVGGSLALQLGLDLESDEALERWLWGSALAAGRGGETLAPDAYRALEARDWLGPESLAGAPLVSLADALAAAGVPKADVAAVQLHALAVSTTETPLARIFAEADDLASLGGRLTRLAPGFGPTAVARFLRPLRDRFPVVDALPLAREAAAAAVHLGWLDADADLEFAPGTLRAAIRDEADPPAFVEIEAALERLGRASCARSRRSRCPLGVRCPVADSASTSGVASFGVSD